MEGFLTGVAANLLFTVLWALKHRFCNLEHGYNFHFIKVKIQPNTSPTPCLYNQLSTNLGGYTKLFMFMNLVALVQALLYNVVGWI